MNYRLDSIGVEAKDLLTKVNPAAKYLRYHLDLAVKDVDEARRWLSLGNETIAFAATGFAEDRVSFVRKIVDQFGYDVEEIGG